MSWLCSDIDVVENDSPGIRLHCTSDHIKCSGLPGTVRTNQAGNRMCLNAETAIINGCYTTKVLAQVVYG